MAQVVKKGDEVEVLRGDDAGSKGKVVRVLRHDDLLIVSGLNVHKRHMKPNMKNKQGGIMDKEAPIHRSNVRLVAAGKKEKSAKA